MIDLGTLGGSVSGAFAVNTSGQVVGYSDSRNTAGFGVSRAFSWTQAGGMIDLSPESTFSAALAVNASGQVVGYSDRSENRDFHAFLWTQAGGLIDLGTLGGGTSVALAVNANGQVVGYSDIGFNTDGVHPLAATTSGA